MKRILLCGMLLVIASLSGCARINPLSPELNNKIDNQNGKIDDIKNNQNGLMLDLMNLKNEQQIQADSIKNLQSGLINQNNENAGIQIFQGDGGLIAGVGIVAILAIVIAFYRSEAIKHQKSAEILAQQIALYDDVNLDNEVFLAAMNSDVEETVYHLMVDSQIKGRSRNLAE